MSALSVLWRMLIGAVAISYLLCVLFLSGLQKEDLDVSMLTKLQRYNVNIDEINNEELRKSCITQDFPNHASENTTNTLTLQFPYEVSNVIIEKNKQYPEDENIKLKKSAKSHTGDSTNFINYTQDQPYIERSKKNDIKSSDARTSEIHKIIIRRAKDDLKTDSPNKIHFSVDLNETDFINKILMNHYKSRIEPTQISIKPTNNENEDKYNLGTKNNNMINNHKPFFLNMRERPHTEDKILFNNSKQEDLEKKLPTEQKLDDILQTINQFKTMFSNNNPILYEQKPKNPVSKYNPDSYSKITQPERSNSNVNSETKPVASQGILTEDLVKKIAQTVKDMVLHDLRRDMELTTTTTQKVEIVSNSHKDFFTNQENIMNKVMNMFQTLSIHQSPLNVLGKNLKNTNIGQSYPGKSANKKYYDLPSKHIEVMITQQPYNLFPQIHKFKSYPAYNMQQKTISRPITFQTNALEIPPLSIPLTHLQNPINQNIIVTTAIPDKMMHYENDNGPSYSDSALLKVYPKEIIQNPLSVKYSKRTDDCPLNHPCNHKNEDIIRFRLSNDGKAQYDTDYYEKINLERIKPGVNNNYETLLANTPRFHEKLERTDDAYQVFGDINNDDCCNSKFAMSQQMLDCCNEKIASRQQMSIANMKRGSYDDSHFRNFLKTQQKVTDMLEQILATKTRSELPRSVETT